MTVPKYPFRDAANNLVNAAEKLRFHGKRIDAAGWPREMIVAYTQLRNAVNRALVAYDQIAQEQRRAAHKRASAENLKNKGTDHGIPIDDR